MENRSPRLLLSKGKYKSSCLWGLVDMFDFRAGRTNQKLLLNRRTMHKHDFDAQHSRKVDTLVNSCERCRDTEDACKTKVKDILQEEEFPTVKQIKKLLKAVKQRRKRSDFESIHNSANNHKEASKTSEKASQILTDHRKEKNLQERHFCSCSDEKSLDSNEFAAMLEEICSQIHQDGRCNADEQRSIAPSRFKHLDEINVQLLQMSAKAFIDQIYINKRYMSKDAVNSKSMTFSDASDILHLNRDLFLELLQDPNSLLVKHIQKLQFPPRERKGIKLFSNSESSECQSSRTKAYDNPQSTMSLQKRNANNLPWQKIKHRYGFSLKRNTTSASNAIVVLKPASGSRKNPDNVPCHSTSQQSQGSLKNKMENTKSAYFSLKEIRRKLKRVVGESQKEQHSISLDDSPNKHSSTKSSSKYVEKGISYIISTGESKFVNDAKRMENQPKPNGWISRKGLEIDLDSVVECKKFNSSTANFSNQRQLDISREAKKHLSERFRKVNVTETIARKRTSRTLQMVLSSPDHEFYFTRRDMSSPVSMQMRFSSDNSIEKGKGVSWPSPGKQNEEVQLSSDSRSDNQMGTSESRPNILEKIDDDIAFHGNMCGIGDDLKPSGYVNVLKENESILPANSNIQEVPCEPNKVGSTFHEPSTEAQEMSEDNGYESSSLAVSSHDKHQRSLLGSSSSSLDIPALKLVDACKNREGHPSPVSVLEPFSPEDTTSPTRIAAKQDESAMQPRHIDFDDHSQVEYPEDPKVNITSCMDEEEYLSAYVIAVMQATNLNFEDLLASSTSIPHDLKTYSVDSVGLFQIDTNCELNLLLDCIHEVLLEVYRCYFGYSPWLSFLKPNIRPVPLKASVVDEVVKEVTFYISPKLEQPTLDQLAGMDTAKFGPWLDLRPDTEDIVIQIADDVLQESIVHTILELQI